MEHLQVRSFQMTTLVVYSALVMIMTMTSTNASTMTPRQWSSTRARSPDDVATSRGATATTYDHVTQSTTTNDHRRSVSTKQHKTTTNVTEHHTITTTTGTTTTATTTAEVTTTTTSSAPTTFVVASSTSFGHQTASTSQPSGSKNEQSNDTTISLRSSTTEETKKSQRSDELRTKFRDTTTSVQPLTTKRVTSAETVKTSVSSTSSTTATLGETTTVTPVELMSISVKLSMSSDHRALSATTQPTQFMPSRTVPARYSARPQYDRVTSASTRNHSAHATRSSQTVSVSSQGLTTSLVVNASSTSSNQEPSVSSQITQTSSLATESSAHVSNLGDFNLTTSWTTLRRHREQQTRGLKDDRDTGALQPGHIAAVAVCSLLVAVALIIATVFFIRSRIERRSRWRYQLDAVDGYEMNSSSRY